MELLKPLLVLGSRGRVSSTVSPAFHVRSILAKLPGCGAGWVLAVDADARSLCPRGDAQLQREAQWFVRMDGDADLVAEWIVGLFRDADGRVANGGVDFAGRIDDCG